MNRNWRVDTVEGSFAVKEIVDVPLRVARRNLQTLSALAGYGVPGCAPRVARSGDVVAEIAQHGYCVTGWVDGSHVPGARLPLTEVDRLGDLLGHVHAALSHSPPEPQPSTQPRSRVTAPDEATTVADRFLAIIHGRESLTAFDRATMEALGRRKELLASHRGQRPGGQTPAGSCGWTHGDFQYRNLLWRHGRIVAVLDWDRLGVRPYAEEVVRTAQVQFGTADGFDLERVSTFVAAYRRVIPLTDDELAHALTRLWWKRMTDFWQLVLHYDRGDHRCDAMFLQDENLLCWWTDHVADVRAAMTG